MPDDLRKAKFVFVRRDAHCAPLQRPYEGPFRVIKTGAKTFKLDIGGQIETITVDRLKLAHLDLDYPVEVAQPRPRGRPKRGSKPKGAPPKQASTPISADPPQHTRSSRQINRPRCYIPSRGGGGGGGAAGPNRMFVIHGTVIISIKLSCIYLTSFSVYGHSILEY